MRKKLLGKAKRIIAFALATVMTVQMIPAYASENSQNSQKKVKKYTEEELKKLVYSNETTDEVLELINQGLDTKTFFQGDLTAGTTKEDLIRWNEEGKDIRDIVHERALENTANILEVYEFPITYASAGGDGKYYLTQVDSYFDGCEVNLGGTGYAGELFNPKTNGTGSSEPWYISLGGEQAMCCTYTGHASVRTDHNYVEGNINSLRNNPYFRGGSSYPVEAYFRGAAYAYETLAYPDSYNSGAGMFDADKQELARKAGGELVYRSGKSINYAVFQIITWRIAQGSFNPDDMSRECAIAKTIFGQMYPPEDWSDTYYNQIESFYEYYALCAKECASGKYNQKYNSVSVKYWQVQGADANNWQDFITWNLNTVPAKDNFKVYKTGKVISNNYYPNATFHIYSDSGCTNKIGEFTTNASGQATIDKIVEGIYYLKEINAPTGTIKSNATITLTVNDDVDSANISNEEYKNGVFFGKYDRLTKQVIKRPGTYAVYEYVNGRYLKLGTFNFIEKGFTNSKGVKIPDYSYVLNTQEMTYHRADGSSYNVNTSSLIYTPVNQGKFKIVEEAAPEGYMLDVNGKTFTMNLTEQDHINDFTTYETGLKDTPNAANIKIRKFDYFTGTDLSGAGFKIQERVGGEWYDVGELVEKTETEGENTYPVYTTSYTNTYTYHDESGKTAFTKTAFQNPLVCTSYNDGAFRIVETKVPEGYIGNYTKRFTVKPTVNNYTYEFTSYSMTNTNSVTNRGISITVKTLKYDEITKEVIKGNDIPATLTIYEYIAGMDKWYEAGKLNYSSANDEYVMDSGYSYKLHDEKGNEIRTSINGTYLPGKLYYTSANMGRFKVVETSSPLNYLMGILNSEGKLTVYEEEFTITPDMEDGKVIDLTDLAYAAKDTGVSSNIEVSKYDALTQSKVESGDAEFTIYENVNNKWLEVGKLIYDEKTELYKSSGMTAAYHNSIGEEVLKTIITDKAGLTYTTANQGRFKVVETKAPSYYQNSGFSREFTITAEVKDTIKFNSVSQGAKDIGIRGTISVEKYDIVTQETVNTFDAEFTVYEKVGNNWLESGKLKYDKAEKRYTGKDVDFIFHNEDGTVTDAENVIEKGSLYYTSANQGRFKVVETKAPLHYLIGSFSKEFTLTKDNEENNFISYTKAAQNFGISAVINIQKYDVLTKDVTDKKDTEFTIQEYIAGMSEWADVVKMKYDTALGAYSTKNQQTVSHDKSGKIIYTNNQGKLYYTTANQGRYRVVETSAPTNYINGSKQYVKEFNITDKNSKDIIDLTSYENSAKNLGISGTVSVTKYDNISREKVKTGDAEFTVYENVNNKWLEAGKLIYDEKSKSYVSSGVDFTFHRADGTVTDTKGVTDYEKGRLYYTSANQGRFKVVETKPPVHYTMDNLYNAKTEIFDKEFIIDTDGKKINYNSYDKAAKNNGEYTYVELLKYDAITKKNVEFTNAVFTIQEYAGSQWLDVCTLNFNDETGHYDSKGMTVKFHDSNGEQVYADHSGRLYYTSANQGRYRVVETTAPDNYIMGSEPYTYEFNVTDSRNNITDLTGSVNAPYDLGIYGTVEVAKYDRITKEKVKTGDAEFKVYEYIAALDEWSEAGELRYDEQNMIYTCEGVEFIFHDSEGMDIDTSDIADYEPGRLYYTTTNKGNFKVEETSSPENYVLDEYSVKFNICNDYTNEEVASEGSIEQEDSIYEVKCMSYSTTDTNAAQDKGITGNIELLKSDKETDKPLSGTKFALQEWSVNEENWLYIGDLTDLGNGYYSTRETEFIYHTGRFSETGEELLETCTELVYTTQNLGRFRIIETQAPEGYMNDGYSYEVRLSEEQTSFDLTDNESRATDTPIKVSLSKKSITTGKDITGATLTVNDIEGNLIDKWVSDGSEHIISGIKPGKYVFTEEAAPKGYVIANTVEFEVLETYEIQKVEMYDEEVKGRVIINKTDKATGHKLAGAKFELKAEDGSFSQILVTDENGYAESETIRFGIYDENGKYRGSKKYTLTEVAAPSGYDIDRTPKALTFEYKDDKTEVVEIKLDITNTKTPEVRTGDYENLGLILLIMTAAAVVTAGAFMKKKLKFIR